MRKIELRALVFLSAAFLGGCGGAPGVHLDSSHPANAQAPAAPRSASSEVLIRYRVGSDPPGASMGDAGKKAGNTDIKQQPEHHGGSHGNP